MARGELLTIELKQHANATSGFSLLGSGTRSGRTETTQLLLLNKSNSSLAAMKDFVIL